MYWARVIGFLGTSCIKKKKNSSNSLLQILLQFLAFSNYKKKN